MDYHLHEFIVYDGDNPIIKFVDNEDAFEFPDDIPRELDSENKLSEFIPKYKRIKYNYDFGDFWQHEIKVGKVNDDYGWNYPVCLFGEGNTHPEDVGGEYGYEQFLYTISHPEAPDHEDMVSWGKDAKI